MKREAKEMVVAELVELGRIATRTAPVPTIGAGEILLHTRAVGLCGTDIKAFRRGHPYFRPPCVLGHEVVGTVAEVGTGVEGFSVGDRATCAPYVECGVCPTCRRGLGELCEHKAFISGALQEYIQIPAEVVRRGTFLVPDGVSDEAATLCEPLACVVNGIERADVRAEDSVLVVGGGPMGALLALIARTITPHVVVSEVSEVRVGLLRRLDLDVIRPDVTPVRAALAERFGEPAADRVLIAVGVRTVAEEALGWTTSGGTALLFGGLAKDDRLEIDPFAVHYREVTIAGSYGFQTRHFEHAVRWIVDHPHAVDGVVTASVGFRDAAAAFARAAEPEALKTVIRFHELD